MSAIQPTPRSVQRSKFRLLKQTTTGAIYAWDENLAKRPDMVEWKHPTREQGSKQATKTPDEIKLESVAQQEEQEPSIAEMAQAVLSKGKKSAITA
jgi:hypothetical protein